ncbi:MAG: hypothetical protein KIT75_03485 [Planctomycetota bacterium]|nr:hypothetical protein [Planctomycetota bacterium]
MSKWGMFLTVGFGALAVAFLSGAFERLFNFDRAKSQVATGVLAAGLALAAGYLAHAGGVIDGNTRNMLIAAGVAIGAQTAFGNKLYSWGSDLASKVGSKTTANEQQAPPQQQPGTGSYDTFANSPVGGMPDGLMSGAAPTGQQAPPTGTVPAQQQAPVYKITYEAAKIPKPDLGQTAITAAADVLGKFLPALVGGSKGGNDVRSLGLLGS